MTFYSYKAKDKEGNIYERKREAKDHIELYSLIREEGGRVLSINEVKAGLHLKSSITLFGGIKTAEKIILARNLGNMISAGLSVTRALGVMGKQVKKPSLKSVIKDLEADVSKGQTLSESMAKRPKVFSNLLVSMVKAGEESGNVAGALSIVANQMEKSNSLIKKVKGALIYPSVILSLMVVIAILMLIYMVPTLTATFNGIGVELPLSTRIIIFMSSFLVNHTVLVLGTLILLVALALAFFRSRVGKRVIDVVSLRIPVIGGIVKEVQSARTARTLSSLLSSGVDMLGAISVTIEVVQNSLYKEALEVARKAVEKGESMSEVFVKYEKLYPLFVGEMVAVGEETGKIAEMLLGVATFYEDEVDQKTKDLSTIIEPVLMIIIGLGVGIFAISMLAPTYSLVNNF